MTDAPQSISTETETPLPCPLCGGEAQIGSCWVGERRLSEEPAVRCTVCSCRATLASWQARHVSLDIAQQPVNPTLWGQIAAVYGELDPEDCKWVDREWAKQRGYILPTDGTSTLAYSAGNCGALIQKIDAEARRYAEMYQQSSDGRNTFVMFADWVSALPTNQQAPPEETRHITDADREYASELLADLISDDLPLLEIATRWFRKARVEHALARRIVTIPSTDREASK